MKKTLLTLTIFATIGLLYALSQGANNPSTIADDATVGTVAWSNPMNATSSDNIYTNTGILTGSGGNILDRNVKIIKADGTIGTTNKAFKSYSSSVDPNTYILYGSSSELWGETWDSTKINDVDFGVVLNYGDISDSHYLKATSFGFTLPVGVTVNGILVEVEAFQSVRSMKIDHIRITVYYTEAVTGARNLQVKTGKLSNKTGKLIIK